MTTKIASSADGTKVLIGTAAEDALQIDATAKTIKGLNSYYLTISTTSYGNDSAAAAGGVPVGGIYNSSGTVKVRVT